MTIKQIAELIGGNVLVDLDKEINSFYCGDFLSRVMAKAPAGCGWLTIMNNINVAGVAVMADIPLVIICEGEKADKNLLERCKTEQIALIQTDLSVFECCKRLGK
jgi:hypothetical protein